jgi:hypothetical protein
MRSLHSPVLPPFSFVKARAENSIGSTGWTVLMIQDAIQGSGSVPGLDQILTELRICYGHGLNRLKHISVFSVRLTPPPLRRLYRDNLGLVKKVSYFSKCTASAPVKCVLHSEYDVVFQAFQLPCQCIPNANPKFFHVKDTRMIRFPYMLTCLCAHTSCRRDHSPHT